MKHCIFDLDGTLLNTLGDLSNAVNHALRTNGMPEHTLEEVRWMVGNGVRKLMERAVPDGDNNPLFEKAFADFRAFYAQHSLDTTEPYEGIMQLLAELKQRGVKMAVVSNKMDSATKPLIKRFFGDFIDVAIGESEGISRKPAPDMVYKAMRELGVTAEDCVYIGDSDVDFHTAQNANIPCISVLWGFRDKAFLQEIGAETFAETPSDLLSLI
ncbi:MAG: HAD-IIIA family hydrolase [Prevotella sp.]|nr:HAD-IIIA family hydrolase [Prevotella sp.]MCF0207984.1 HAD-IIIA family hydrolase [Bacteroidaceae bacterium]